MSFFDWLDFLARVVKGLIIVALVFAGYYLFPMGPHYLLLIIAAIVILTLSISSAIAPNNSGNWAFKWIFVLTVSLGLGYFLSAL